jgi:integrase
MASVRKRKLLSGEVRWQLDYRDLSGTRRSKQFKTKAEAVIFETRVRAEIAAGTHVADSAAVTVREAGDLWLQRAGMEGLEASTVRQYRQHLQHHINPLIGAVKLSRLSTPAVEDFRDKLLQTRSRPLSRAVLASLKAILTEAQRRGLAGQNVAAKTKIKDAKRDREEVEIPTKEEIRAIITRARETWPLTRQLTSRQGTGRVVALPWHPLILTAIFSGLRLSELRGLTWSHVAFDEGVIRVRQRADFQNRIGPPKSKAGNRDVPLAPIALNTLKTWKISCPLSPMKLVFPTKTGGILSGSNVHRQCWRPILCALNLIDIEFDNETREQVEKPRYTFHCLRHTAASLFIEQGWTPKKFMTVMGHSSIQMTFDLYGHLWKILEDDAKAVAQIEARLLG